MLGWMDDEALHRTLTTGRATYWSRSRAGVLGQGRHLRPRPAREVGRAGLRRRHPAGEGRPGRCRLPHRRPHLLRRRRRAAARGVGPAAALEAAATDRRRGRDDRRIALDLRDVPRRWPSTAGSSRSARRLLADGETPVGLYRKLAAERPGHVPARVGRARDVWSRYSFVGVRSARHADRARRRGALVGHAAGRRRRPTATRWTCCARPSTRCTPRAATAACRRSPAAWSATSATTSSAGWSAAAARRRTTCSCPS